MYEQDRHRRGHGRPTRLEACETHAPRKAARSLSNLATPPRSRVPALGRSRSFARSLSRFHSFTRSHVLTVGLILFAAAAARAQTTRPNILRDVGIDQKLNAQVPLDLEFRDETGKTVTLSDYFHDKPVILTLVYYRCPMLCTLVLNGMVRSLHAINLEPGKDFEIVTVSFDPREGPELAAAKKATYIKEYNRPGGEAGWHFLVGNPESIKRLTEAVGFRYAYDAAHDQYVHASAIMVLTPQARVSKYFYGIDYDPKDLRLGLVDASGNKIGSLSDQILLFCCQYDPATGRYGLAIMNIIRVVGMLTLLALGSFVFLSVRRERRRRRAAGQEVPK
jgi:protein SCO1/2